MNSENKKIKLAVIIEVIGKPPEHLVETLNDLIKQIGEEKNVEVIEKKVNEPILMKDQKEFYTTFAEIELEVEEISMVSDLIFKYMPAHLEIISPESISLSNNDLNNIFNGLARKLHGYDEIARILETEKKILEKKIKQLISEKDTNSEEKE